ncbi:MAG: outer membrane beta-barrel domain-containing protein [Bdellovibrionaceae bacterium]|nr:outer membrane beta-barrel domain-containing protein [Bdellovibrionales bacterium]MCB9083075.1 outer membrane beta-barrel domain-containing protein [Pseudobdellovibrionaceae bacterium]
MTTLRILIGLCLLVPALYSQAGDLQKDLESLGGNKDILRRARALDPKNRLRVVQNRLVDRNLRLEVAAHYGSMAGGDPYLNTDNIGAQLEFHINPRWSLGARYYSYSNSLSTEGERRAESARAGKEPFFDSDSAIRAYMGVVTWYPIYGKLNFFDWAVAQFDIYALAGAGQVELESGPSDTYTFGAGIGIWLSQHISTRFEVRYQGYEDRVYDDQRKLDLTVVSAGIGFLL